MRIVFITAPPNPIPGREPGALPDEAIRRLSDLHPEHDWFILQGMPRPGGFSFFKRRKNLQEMRQLKPDLLLFASIDNLELLDDVPVAVMVTESPGKQPPSVLKMFSSIKTVITDTPWLKNDLMRSFSFSEKQIKLLRLMNEDIQPEWYNRLLTREKYAGGNEYFYYGGTIGADGKWEQVLHAFSKFKKWQQSGLQLVLTGAIDPGYIDEFQGKFGAYKYRQDVICVNETAPEEKKHLADAAFAMLADGRSFAGRMDIVRAFRAGVPVICEEHELTQEFAADNVLYAHWQDAAVLSRQMINLYKNEDLNNQLVQKGKEFGELYNWQQSLDDLYNCIVAAAER